MFKVYFKKHWHIHFLNRLSVYWEPYLTTVTSEYWTGHKRKRVLRIGNLTVWIKSPTPEGEKEKE